MAPPSTKCLQVYVSSPSSKRCVCGWELALSFISIIENRRLWRPIERLMFTFSWRLFDGGIAGSEEGLLSSKRRVVSDAPTLNFHGSVSEPPAVSARLRKLGTARLFSRLFEYAL